MIYITICKV